MVRVTVWLQLLLVVLILRQSAAVSDQCSKLQEEISRLERDIVNITELNNESELRADNCNEHLTKQILISQATDRNLTQSEAVISGLKKQLDEYKTELETKEDVLKNNNKTQTQLQTDIDGLKKTVQSMNRTIQRLCETPEHACRYLFEAAKYGDVNTVKILFKCSYDNCTVYRNTPLTYAAWYGKMAVVRVLLQCGVNVDITDGHESTALHLAAFTGHLEVCRLLLEWGAKVNHLDRWKDTALHWAAWKGHLSVVKLLVERGADVTVKNGDGQTASEIARSKGRKDVADALDQVACRYLLDAAKSGDVNNTKILIKYSNDNCTSDYGYRDTPLIYAASNGHVAVVRVLLEGGANVDRANAYGNTALHLAASYGRLDVCGLLLDWGAKVDHLDKWHYTALHFAAWWGHLSVVKLLVERGADVSVKNVYGRTASDWARIGEKKGVADWLDWVCRSLLDAAKSGDVNTVKMLSKYSNDNCTTDDKYRDTPLIYAAEYGHVEVVRVLLEGGANVDRADVAGSTALHYAAYIGHLDVCRVLLDFGAKVDRLDGRQYTALHNAAREGHLSVVKLLVERGADVNVKNVYGQTALHDAARWGYLYVVKLLVENGADVSVKDVDGRTASDVARSRGKKDVADWLDRVSRS